MAPFSLEISSCHLIDLFGKVPCSVFFKGFGKTTKKTLKNFRLRRAKKTQKKTPTKEKFDIGLKKDKKKTQMYPIFFGSIVKPLIKNFRLRRATQKVKKNAKKTPAASRPDLG